MTTGILTARAHNALTEVIPGYFGRKLLKRTHKLNKLLFTSLKSVRPSDADQRPMVDPYMLVYKYCRKMRKKAEGQMNAANYDLAEMYLMKAFTLYAHFFLILPTQEKPVKEDTQEASSVGDDESE